MGFLQAYREYLSTAAVYTLGLAAFGVVYPAVLFRYETVPSLESMDPFLAVGALIGFTFDRLLAPGDLPSIVNGSVRSTRLWSTAMRLAGLPRRGYAIGPRHRPPRGSLRRQWLERGGR